MVGPNFAPTTKYARRMPDLSKGSASATVTHGVGPRVHLNGHPTALSTTAARVEGCGASGQPAWGRPVYGCLK